MNFELDTKKAGKNKRKHDVTFHEATTVFSDSLAITFMDPDHSKDEDRFLTFGLSKFNRLLVVSHTDTGVKTLATMFEVNEALRSLIEVTLTCARPTKRSNRRAGERG